jgi:two-component system OmpR family sensor kinase/two-component system sensor histidine kinase BaeS
MNKLWVRLTLAFGLVAAVAIIIVAVLGNYRVSTQFRQFVNRSQMMESSLAPQLANFYAQRNSWAGVETVFENSPELPVMGMGRGPGMGRGTPQFTLADANGHVVYAEAEVNTPGQLNKRELAQALPLISHNNLVGYLSVDTPPSGQMMMTGPAQAFLGQINRILFQAGIIAGILAIVMGIVMARNLSAPLGRLAAAARQVSRGEFDQRVPVKGATEIADLSATFNDMAGHLQESETLRRNLVADVAHELRTPLSVIQGNLQAILDDVYPLDKAEIAAIYDETLILNRLIGDLRELAQAEAGQLNLNIQSTNLALLVASSVDAFAELTRQKNIVLAVDVPDGLPPAQADPDRVRQILHNLLSNALRHTPEGGTIDVAAAAIAPDGQIKITVSDTGSGIPAEDLPRVFDRFWRADRSRSREYGGSGLGLAITRQLVAAHGGRIGVESNGVPGQGSQFWFTLPTGESHDLG